MSGGAYRVSARARLRVGATHGTPSGVQRIALPHRAAMVTRYGGQVAHLPVYSGPGVVRALERRGADGASVDGAILLPAATVPPELVAHEVVHALQQVAAHSDGPTLVHRLESAPAAGGRSAAENEAGVLTHPESQPAPTPQHLMPAGVIGLRRSTGGPPAAERPAPTPLEPARPATEQTADSRSTAHPEPASADSSPAAMEAGASPTFSPAPVPATALDPADAAARQAAKAAAETALADAETPSAVLDAYAQMAPSVKAVTSADLGTSVARTSEGSTSEMAAATAEVSVRLDGEQGALPLPAPIVVPGEQAAATPTTPAAPEIDVPAAPDQPEVRTDPGFGPMIEHVFGAGATPEAVGEQIEEVSTRNPGIRTQVTERADIPLVGANDPARMDDDTRIRGAEAAAGRTAATDAVVQGPGPEAVVPRAMEHTVAIESPTAATAPLTQPEGAAQLNDMTLPPEVLTQFDEDTGPAMAATANAARAEMSTAETERDAAHQEAVRTAEADRAAAEGHADAAQRDTIITNRRSIQSERQRTVDRQQAEVERVETEAETARAARRAEADERVATDRAHIDSRYAEAERDSQAEVTRGEGRAEEERERAEREAEDQSWWDRATNFIRRAFEALTNAINAVFDAVRSAVSAIIDAAVTAVTAIIEAAAAALQALVSAFGELLKGLVDGLLGQIFPELAAALTAFIDEAVATVNETIDGIAEALVQAVEAVGASLNAAIDALLDLYQNAINGALAVLEAAMTGDWGALLLKVLDAVLKVLGLDPAAFHAMLAQASEAVGTIVNDPGGFLHHLLDTVVGGVRAFADNFATHLREGIIGWLTGALGGIQLPERWDIWGVLDLARQVLGLTWDFVRERARRIIGEENVARLEAAFSWVATLVTEGWPGLWNRIMGELQSLTDMVLGAIREFVLERVVLAAIRWLASLFNPVGALVQLVMTIWNVYQFVSNQLQRLFGIAQAVVQGISDIARGVLGPAMQRVEQVLADLLPVVIDLLMSLLGVTGVATRVREIIGEVRASIARAVDNLLERVLGPLGLSRGGAGEQPAAAQPGNQIGVPVPVTVAGRAPLMLAIHRVGAGGATVMLGAEPTPVDEYVARADRAAAAQDDDMGRARIHEKITSASQILEALNPIADRAASARDEPTRQRETHAAQEHQRRLAPALGEMLSASSAQAGVPVRGELLQRTFSMDGRSHTLTLTGDGRRAALTMASVRPRDIHAAARAGRDEARAKHLDADIVTELELIMSQAEQYDRWIMDHYDALVLPARDDHAATVAQSRALFDMILHTAIEFGRRHHFTDLVALGHPSLYVLNDEVRTEYRSGWRERFYAQGWSSTIENSWKTTELARLGRAARTRFPTHPYVLDPRRQAFLVEDRNSQYPPSPEVDYVRPRNVHIDHVRAVSDHFQTEGNAERQPERERWYELQSNLQILNERWNTAKGGPRVTNWRVTLNFRGPDE